ncbi:MAG: hypothetical protein IKZ74_07650 [Clostridiales bacterium]|nr:hypothetical protein [Clostridiales bacterium]
MKIQIKKHVSLILALGLLTASLFTACSSGSDEKETSGSPIEKVTGASIQLHGYDWGPSIDKVIVSDSQYGPFTDLSPTAFSAVEEKEDNSSSKRKTER